MTSPILCFGGLHRDTIGRTRNPLEAGNSVLGEISDSIGGVAANIAIALAQTDESVILGSVIGDDDDGRWLEQELSERGVEPMLLIHPVEPTGRYVSVEDGNGDVIHGLIDAPALENADANHLIEQVESTNPKAVVLDANLSGPQLATLATHFGDVAVFANAVSPTKAPRLAAIDRKDLVLFCNRAEWDALEDQALSGTIVITDGSRPVTVKMKGHESIHLVPLGQMKRSRTGAGDRFMALTIAHRLAGSEIPEAVDAALSERRVRA
ncbi:MAG: PfkB family carbohydrate kinase [Pseudomonadota bacterium]